MNPKGPKIEKINLAWNFRSRLKISISLENVNPDLLHFPIKIGVWWVARLKFSISLEHLKILNFFNLWALREFAFYQQSKGFAPCGKDRLHCANLGRRNVLEKCWRLFNLAAQKSHRPKICTNFPKTCTNFPKTCTNFPKICTSFPIKTILRILLRDFRTIFGFMAHPPHRGFTIDTHDSSPEDSTWGNVSLRKQNPGLTRTAATTMSRTSVP